MSTEEAQFTITRKRKRQVAIDPCLGFYCNISTLAVSRTPTAIAKNADNENAADHLEWTPLPQDPSENESHHVTNSPPQLADLSSEQTLTVEGFLQRSALGRGRIHIRKYGRKNRNRRIVQSDDECDEDDRSRSHDTSGQFNDSRPAALRLVPIQRLKKDSTKPKPRAIRLWNTATAKGVPFRTSSFSEPTKTNKEAFARGSLGGHCHPLNTWSTFRKPTHRNETIHKASKVPLNRKHSIRCAPLVFVPLAAAEEAYDKKFHSASVNKRKGLPSSGHVEGSQCPPVVPLDLIPTDHIENVSPNQSCFPSSPCIPSANFPELDCVSESALEISGSLPLTAIAATVPASTPCSKKTASGKRLKPLGSFLEGFIDRVRTATQAENATTSRLEHQATMPGLVEPISNHGLQQTLSTTRDRAPGSSRTGRTRQPLCDQIFTHYNGHMDYATIMKVDRFEDALLDEPDDICSISEEFSPYVPPATPFDINAALLAYTQAGNGSIQLSFESR